MEQATIIEILSHLPLCFFTEMHKYIERMNEGLKVGFSQKELEAPREEIKHTH